LRSKGIHLIVPTMTQTHALTIAADGGHFFVLPWRGFSLLGTTDTAFAGAPDAVGVSERDIADFLAFINAHLPGAHLQRGDVRHFYAGLRPLVDDGRGNTYEASRHAELVDHSKDDGVQGLFSAIGGKWTTSRDLAEKAVDAAVARLRKPANRCETAMAGLPGAAITGIATVQNVPNEHIARLYGLRAPQMLGLAEAEPNLRERVSSCGDIAAQVVFAVRAEMALTLDDVVLRRTGIGQLGPPDDAVLNRCAVLMGNELGWSEARRQSEIATVKANYRTQELQ
jgi:glycerol-3-phosphate dehydrogenase